MCEGDTVTLLAKVNGISSSEKDCNCTFTIIPPVGVDEKYIPSFAGNTRLGTVVVIVPEAATQPGRHPASATESQKALHHQHAHRTPDDKAKETLRRLRQAFLDLAVTVDALLPQSRERSLAQTKIDEARMWACNAATNYGDISEPLEIKPPS